MAKKWVNTLLPICLLIPCTQLIEGLPVQQVPSPSQQQESEWDQCKLSGYQEYEEQCGTKTVSLPSCNPGYRRVWRCVTGDNGLPEGFDPNHDLCDNCQPNTFQKFYNKCRVCHPCSVCDEGETIEKECEMDSDTICTSTPLNPEPTTRSSPPFAPPLNETTTPSKEAAHSLELSTAATPTDGSTGTTDQTGESPEVLPITTPYAPKKWLYICLAIIVVLAVLLVSALIGWWREYLLRKKLQDNQENIPLDVLMGNGDARHEGDGDRGHEERDPLLEQPNAGAEADQNHVDRDAVQASGDPAVDGTTSEGSPDDAADVDAIGRSGSASDTATDDIDGAHGSAADVAKDGVYLGAYDRGTGSGFKGTTTGSLGDSTKFHNSVDAGTARNGVTTDEGKDDGKSASPRQVLTIPDETPTGASDGAAEHLLDQRTNSNVTLQEGATSACGDGKDAGIDGAVGGALSSRGGLDFNIPDKNPIGLSDGASDGTSDVKDINASGDSHTISADGGGIAAQSGLDIEDIANKSTPSTPATPTPSGFASDHQLDGASVHSSGDTSGHPSGGASGHSSGGASVHSSGLASGHPSSSASVYSSGDASVHPSGSSSVHPSGSSSVHPSSSASVHSSGGATCHLPGSASGHPSDGAPGHPSGGAGDDDRRTNTTPEQVSPVIQADGVVTTMFLQHVAQEIPHIQIKKICRMLGLQDKDIDNVEALTHKDEQGYEFLKRLLGDVGKDLTYRSLLQAINKSKNKHYADNLIREFDILL